MTDLERLNAYRAAQGLDPVAAFRKNRHQKFLDDIVGPWEQLQKDAALATPVVEPEPEPEPAAPVVVSESGKVIPKKVGGAKSYKELARLAPAKSEQTSPVEFVKQFLTLNPGIGRKDAVAALVGAGINIHTARTQVQKFRATNK